MPRIGLPHQQIASLIRDSITTGTYSPGTALPPVRLLAGETGCAVHTVRKGIAVLAAEGLVRTVPGKGTFVR